MSTPLSPRTQSAQRPGQSPLRFLFALMARLRTVDGPSIETDLALEALQEEQQGLTRCANAAGTVETALDRYCRLLKEAAADSILTPKECQSLDRALQGIKRNAHSTTRYIGALR